MIETPGWPLSPSELEAAARERLDVAAYDHIAGGAEDERTLQANLAAFHRLSFRPHVLAGVSDPDLRCRVLGTDLTLPVLLAPVAVQRLAHPRGELASAAAAQRAGTLLCLSTLSSTAIEEVAPAAGSWWFQLYVQRDPGVTRELIQRAAAAGCSALVLTADLPVLGRRERDERNGFRLPSGVEYANLRGVGSEAGAARSQLGRYAAGSLDPRVSWAHLEQLTASSPVPVVVKGVLRGDDARRAVAAGAAGVIVSNHGGRQLDGAIASLDALPEVRDAVGDVPVLMDGGVRRGTDVLIALCRGAAAVLVGRPYLWALAVDGEDGVVRLLDQLRAEISTAMRLLGAASLSALGPGLLGPAI